MKFCKTKLLLMLLPFFSEAGHAALSIACNQELRDLVVPPLKGVAMNKKDIRVELADSSGDVYGIRLFVAADSPDNLDGEVSIGWVNLDVGVMKAFDVTDDINNRVESSVSKNEYKSFVSKCLRRN